MSWPQLVFGWPTIILALGVFAPAFTRPRSWLGFVGLASATPFLWYASHAPRGGIYALTVFVALAAAAWFLRQDRRRLAALCVAPFVLMVGALAVLVLSQ